MKTCCLCDDTDTALGFKLAGAEVVICKDKIEAELKLKELSRDSNIGIIFIAENIFDMLNNNLIKEVQIQNMPLLLKIPTYK